MTEPPTDPPGRPDPGPPAGPDTPSEPLSPARGGLSGRVWIVVTIAVITAVVLGTVLIPGSGDDDPATPTVACQGGGSAPLAQGLEPQAGPEELPPAVLCAFDSDVGVDVATLLGGQPLVINFWATWCAPCVAEMPDFQALHEAAGGRVHIVGVNTQDAARRSRPFAEDLGITYDLLRDPAGEYFRANAGFGMPTTLFVTPDGAIRFRQTGPLTLTQMADLIAEHLGVQVSV